MEAPYKGRGATHSPTGRYNKTETVSFEDGWFQEPPPNVLPTIVTPEITRTIITRNDSPDIPFDRSINPYKGCEHGCVYCFARPTHAYLGLSPGIDFETKITSKPDAAKILRRELSKPTYKCNVMALGSNTDPYQPIERKLRITRQILEVLSEFNHPVGIVTKSQLVLRDADILTSMAKWNLANVFVSVTTLDAELARTMEPRASTPERRLETIRELNEAGIPVGVLASPMIPALNDSELEEILSRAAQAGASMAGYILVRLPHEVKEIFTEWLNTHYPMKAKHVLSLIAQSREGKLNDPNFGMRMRGQGFYADFMKERFEATCRRLKLNRREHTLDMSKFRSLKNATAQMSLFQ